jgi:organic radical activating enzyme
MVLRNSLDFGQQLKTLRQIFQKVSSPIKLSLNRTKQATGSFDSLHIKTGSGALDCSLAADLLIVELTSLCNLSCTYCSVSHPEYHGTTSPLNSDEIISIAQKLGCKKIQLHLHGESTIVKGWEQIAEKLINNGYQVHLLSNLAKNFSMKEIEILAQLVLSVSIDTLDSDLFKKIRRGSDLGTVLGNMFRIQAVRKSKGYSQDIKWNVVLCQETLESVFELIEVGVSLGVTQFFFCNLSEIEGLKGITSVLKTEESTERAKQIMRKITKFLDEKQIPFDFSGIGQSIDYLDQLVGANRKYNPEFKDQRSQHPFKKSPIKSYFQSVAPGQTRLCFDPWKRVVIHSDLGVGLCERMAPVGSLKLGAVSEIVQGTEAARFRKGLTSGNLEPECSTCSKRPTVTQTEFLSRLSVVLNQ